MNLFEYAVIRFVPKVEREEFLNVGVIVYCASGKFLQVKYLIDEGRLTALYPAFNMDELKDRLQVFCIICKGEATGGSIAQLPIASRFRWLTASRSTVVQTSPVHPGLCTNAQQALERLFDQLVSLDYE
ncbi:MAG: DUF3037 domain-containing protein [Chitinophagaceae bacterium]|nr:DUF3037 domain-containing protein [Chitinophagaceae bacterium]